MFQVQILLLSESGAWPGTVVLPVVPTWVTGAHSISGVPLGCLVECTIGHAVGLHGCRLRIAQPKGSAFQGPGAGWWAETASKCIDCAPQGSTGHDSLRSLVAFSGVVTFCDRHTAHDSFQPWRGRMADCPACFMRKGSGPVSHEACSREAPRHQCREPSRHLQGHRALPASVTGKLSALVGCSEFRPSHWTGQARKRSKLQRGPFGEHDHALRMHMHANMQANKQTHSPI